jgi:hypothetical protein
MKLTAEYVRSNFGDDADRFEEWIRGEIVGELTVNKICAALRAKSSSVVRN